MSQPPESSTLRAPPPEAWAPLHRLAELARRPLEQFLRVEAASGIVLLLAALVAMVWINSDFGDSYISLWATPVGIKLGAFAFERSLAWVVNDILMVVFFFVVGLEIKRELVHGELSEWRRAALPAVAALGGMAVPAIIYALLHEGPGTARGWGVPMATDIAFAVGVLALLGKRVPPALRVLLLAVAVIDDLGAIVVIALFYSTQVTWSGLLLAAVGVALILAQRVAGVRVKAMYIAPGALLWAGIYVAGIHPTIAGVIIGLLTPVRAWLGREGFVDGVKGALSNVERSLPASLHQVDLARREARSPAESIIEALHPYVAYVIMPLFALANAGVALGGLSLDGSTVTVSIGVGLGLVLGKPLGILLACYGSIWTGLARLPVGLGSKHVIVLGVTAGIGFTMALFIAQLAFPDDHLLGAAKVGVLGASATAGVLALVVGRVLLSPQVVPGMALTVDEAERSTAA